MKRILYLFCCALLIPSGARAQEQKIELKDPRFGSAAFGEFGREDIAVAVPQRMTYQGVLTSFGLPMEPGTYTFDVNMFNALEGGTSQWHETISSELRNGTFTLVLGEQTPLPAFDTQFYVEITVSAGPAPYSYPQTLSPRTQLTAAPYALAPWIPATTGSNIYFNAGKVGIGTANPVDKLEVAGVIRSTLGGIRFPDGTTQTTAAAAGQWVTNGSNISNTNSGYIGIGTASPIEKLHVNGNARVESNSAETILRIRNTTVPENEWLMFATGTASSKGTRKFIIQDNSFPYNRDRLTIDSIGNVGIGTTTPSAKLDVSGNMKIADGTQGAGKVLTSDANGVASWQAPSGSGGSQWSTNGNNISNTNSGYVGIGTSSPNALLTLSNTYNGGNIGQLHLHSSGTEAGVSFDKTGNNPQAFAIKIGDNSTGGSNLTIYDETADFRSMVIASPSGNVGIGVTYPSAKLDVNGNVKIADGTQGAGKVLTSDANGVASWQTPAGGGGGSQWSINGNNISSTNSGNVGIGTSTPEFKLSLDSDGSIMAKGTHGSGQTLTTSGPGARLMWYPRKSAFRAGYATGVQWDDANIGDVSFAAGYGATASGIFSTAIGGGSIASGIGSTALGFATNASGNYSTAAGSGTTAGASVSTALGQFNVGGGDPASWIPTDPLVEIGNGSDPGHKANAVTVLKNGNVGIGTASPARPLEILTNGQTPLFVASNHTDGTWMTLRNSAAGGADWSLISTGPGNGEGAGNLLLRNDNNGNIPLTLLGSGDVVFGSGNVVFGSGNAVFGSGNVILGSGNSVFSSGNVGIGTSTPEFKLSLEGDGGIMAKGAFGSGQALTTTGAGTRFMWYPKKGAFRAGYVSGTEWDDANIGELSTALGTRTMATGDYSFVAGDRSTALGYVSTALGQRTLASGAFSTAMGLQAEASSYASFAIGRFNVGGGDAGIWVETDPLFEIGNGNGGNIPKRNALTVLKSGDIGVGVTHPTAKLHVGGTPGVDGIKFPDGTFQTTAYTGGGGGGGGVGGSGAAGKLAFWFGATTLSSNSNLTWDDANTQLGIGTSNPEFMLSLNGDGGIMAKGVYGSGQSLTTSGAGARLIWYPKKAAFRAGFAAGTEWDDANIGVYSAAIGRYTTASGVYSTAMGQGTTASGSSSVAMGSETRADGSDATAIGTNTTASGSISTAMGSHTTASGYISTAMGSHTTASGDWSTAMGYTTTAAGNASTSMGYNTTAEAFASVSMGRSNVGGGDAYNWVATDPLFEIGNGVNDSQRSNAVTVLKNGNVGIGIANPGLPLHVQGANSGSLVGRLSQNSTETGLSLENTATGGADWGLYSTGGSSTLGQGNFVIQSNGAAGNAMLIDNTGNVGIGTTTPGASNLLELASTTKGFVLPRMTKPQRDAIASPIAGMMIYQTDNTPGLRVYNGTNWIRFTETAD